MTHHSSMKVVHDVLQPQALPSDVIVNPLCTSVKASIGFVLKLKSNTTIFFP